MGNAEFQAEACCKDGGGMIEKAPFLFWPLQASLTTLIFHRVLPVTDPLRPHEPDAAHFDRLMRFISDNFTVLPLSEAVDRLQEGCLPRRCCSITFDDGYADNLTVALPILEKYRLPATVFIATGYLDGGRMFNDAVIDAIAFTKKTELDLDGIGLGKYSLVSIKQKHAAINAILNRIKFSPPELRDEQVAAILEAIGCSNFSDDIMLTSSQVRELSDRGVEIGGHTVAHSILSTLDDQRAKEEIMKGKQKLEAITGKPVTSFAYPNGKPGRDYYQKHVSIVRELGFKVAVTTAPGVGLRSGDHLQLPRFSPWGTSNLKMGVQILRNAWTGQKAT